MRDYARSISEFLRAGSHPVRVRIMLAILAAPRPRYHGKGQKRAVVEGGISPLELMDALGADSLSPGSPSLGTVFYHVRILAEWGHVEQLRTEPVRGAVKHYYVATKRGRRFAELVRKLANEEGCSS